MKTCSKCGVEKDETEFYKKGGKCKGCVKSYGAAWGKDNPERVKQRRRDWYEKNRTHCCEKSKKWRIANPEKDHEFKTKYYVENKAKIVEKSKARYLENKASILEGSRLKWRSNIVESREEARRYSSKWRSLNVELARELDRAKYSKIAENPTRYAIYREVRDAWRVKNPDAAKEIDRRRYEKARDNLSDAWVRKNHLRKIKNPPQELIELKRINLQIKRFIKQQQTQKEN